MDIIHPEERPGKPVTAVRQYQSTVSDEVSVKLWSSDEPTIRETNVESHIRYDAAKAIMAEQTLHAECARARQREGAACQGTRDTWTRSN